MENKDVMFYVAITWYILNVTQIFQNAKTGSSFIWLLWVKKYNFNVRYYGSQVACWKYKGPKIYK